MNISQIKKNLNVNTIEFQKQVTQDGEVTPWYATWDNINRVRIVAHEDVIKAAPDAKNLFLKSSKQVSGSGNEYILHIMCVGDDKREVVAL